MSNTGFSVEALLAAGISKDDPAVQKAMKFIGRCQNCPARPNDQATPETTEDDKGGFVRSRAGDQSPHAPRSAACARWRYDLQRPEELPTLGHRHPRVKSAVTWVRNHYARRKPRWARPASTTYYHTFAKAMDALRR